MDAAAKAAAKAAVKAAEKLARRMSVMESVRPTFVNQFHKTVTDMVKNTPFRPDQCIELEIARGAARSLGINEQLVKIADLHNNWKSAEFTHTVSTPMPPPPKRGMPQDPPVITTTIFKIIAKSALIDATYLKVNEDNTMIGGEVLLSSHQRPNPSAGSHGSSSSAPPKNSGGKGKGKKH